MKKYVHFIAGMFYVFVPFMLYITRADGVFEQMWAEKPLAMILLCVLCWTFIGLFHMIFIVLSHMDDIIGEKRE